MSAPRAKRDGQEKLGTISGRLYRRLDAEVLTDAADFLKPEQTEQKKW